MQCKRFFNNCTFWIIETIGLPQIGLVIVARGGQIGALLIEINPENLSVMWQGNNPLLVYIPNFCGVILTSHSQPAAVLVERGPIDLYFMG